MVDNHRNSYYLGRNTKRHTLAKRSAPLLRGSVWRIRLTCTKARRDRSGGNPVVTLDSYLNINEDNVAFKPCAMSTSTKYAQFRGSTKDGGKLVIHGRAVEDLNL